MIPTDYVGVPKVGINVPKLSTIVLILRTPLELLCQLCSAKQA